MTCALAQAPAGDRPAHRGPSASILPGGRIIAPAGQQYPTGAGPFGLALSGSGKTVATANLGPGTPSLTVLERGKNWEVRQLPAAPPSQGPDAAWRGVSLGVAFADEHSVFVAEGNSGRVAWIDLATGDRRRAIDLNQNGYRDSFSGDLALDSGRKVLYVADQANFRVAVADIRSRQILASIPVGRLPFAMTLSPDRRKLYVANTGMFRYQAVPEADLERAAETGLHFPAFGFPGLEAAEGVERETARGAVRVAGLGDADAGESNSVFVIDVSESAAPKVEAVIRTGRPFRETQAGSAPSAILAAAGRVYVSNTGNDSITVIDAASNQVLSEIPLRIPRFPESRGILPMGLAYDEKTAWLLVAEAGINAVGVIDTRSGKLAGHIPAGWFPTRIGIAQDTVFVTNLRGQGSGPSAVAAAGGIRVAPTASEPGSVAIYGMPSAAELAQDTVFVLRAGGLDRAPADEPPFPSAIRHVVLIVKGGRSFDEVLGDMAAPAGETVLGAPPLARFGRAGYASGRGARLSLQQIDITPNHHAIAERWSFSDNFYADSVSGAEGRLQLAGLHANAWSATSLREALGGGKDFRLSSAPGRLEFPAAGSPATPEMESEAGSIWRRLAEHGVSFYNFGAGLDLPGAVPASTPGSGAAFLTNAPMTAALYAQTSRRYPGFNLAVSDTERAARFTREVDMLLAKPGSELPQFVYIYLPNDAGSAPRANYPYAESFLADNDSALGRIVQYLSESRWWSSTAILVTEDSAVDGLDHIDRHRTLLLCAGPWAKKGYVSHRNTSVAGLLKTVFAILGVPSPDLAEASSGSLRDCFDSVPDLTPYRAVAVDPRLFDVGAQGVPPKGAISPGGRFGTR